MIYRLVASALLMLLLGAAFVAYNSNETAGPAPAASTPGSNDLRGFRIP